MKLRIDRRKFAAPAAVSVLLTGSVQSPSDMSRHFLPPPDLNSYCEITNFAAPDDKIDQAQFEIQIPTLADEDWTKQQNQKFQQLAVKEALGTISSKEIVELEYLSKQRRELESPRTGEEIIQEYQRIQITQDLLRSLRKFVNFYESTSSPRNPSKRQFT